jgi:hypothetical protein
MLNRQLSPKWLANLLGLLTLSEVRFIELFLGSSRFICGAGVSLDSF